MKICLIAILLLFALGITVFAADKPGNPEWYKKNLYTISFSSGGEMRVESKGKHLSVLADFDFYLAKKQWKLKLVSKLGFSLSNIPLNDVYFFNEAIAVFLEGEKLLPLSKKWLEDNNYQSKSLSGLKFVFPDKPVIDEKNGWTKFWDDSGSKGGYVLGLTDFVGANRATVTYGLNYNDDESVIVHEYIHMCGYSPQNHNRGVFKGALRYSLFH